MPVGGVQYVVIMVDSGVIAQVSAHHDLDDAVQEADELFDNPEEQDVAVFSVGVGSPEEVYRPEADE